MRWVRNAIGVFLRMIMVASLIGTMSSEASAQSMDGWLGWASPHTSTYFASPDAACRSQWQYYQGDSPKSRYIGYSLGPGNLNRGGCQWTQYQYLCPQETGGGITSCGTIFPTWIELRCQAGYVPLMGQYCVQDSDLAPARSCNCKKNTTTLNITDITDDPLNNGSSLNPTVGNPIAVSSGDKILTASDYATADGNFVISRSYRSMPIGRSTSFQSALVGLAGGWAFDFMYEVQLATFSGSPTSPNAKLAIVAPDGTAYDFVMQSGGTFVPDTTTGAFYAPTNLKIQYVGTLPSDLSTLQSASTQWQVTDGDDTVWVFQTFTRPNTTTPYAVGRPTSRTTRGGYAWNFIYAADNSLQSVTDSFGRQATFSWSQFYVSSLASPPAGGLPYAEAVKSVALPDGTSLRYTYDPPPATGPPSTSRIQRLIKVERLSTTGTTLNSTSYAYGDSRYPQAITAVTDFNGIQTASYTYDSRGRAVTTTHPNGVDAYSIANSENTSELVSRVTGPLGKIEDYHFQRFGSGYPDYRLASIAGEASANTPASSTSFTYGSDNFIDSVTDEEGRVTNYTRDSRGRPTALVEAYGTPQSRTTTVTWDSTFNVPDRVVRPGLQVDYTYYSNGQLQTRTETDTTTGSVPYSTNGQTRTWTYTWGTGGRLASVNGPKPADGSGHDDTLTYAYDTSGNLQTVTNGLGQVTTFASYDANGRPGTMTDANGIVTAFTYDTLGRTKTITVRHPTNSSLDATTSFDYDAHDRVVDVTLPSTDALFLDYNAAGQLTDMHAASGERRDYTYDADGNVTSETVRRPDISVSQQISRSFDELGRVMTEAQIAPNKSHFAYDKLGNLTGITAPNGNASSQAFDPLNRMISTVAPDSGTTTRTYDALDNLATNTDPVSVTTQYTRDGFGDVVQEVSPDRGTSIYYYNQAGELTASIDGRGQRIDYTRDILGRVTQKVPAGRPSSETISYTWDTAGISGSYGVGRLSSVTDGTGTTSFAYDHRGNLLTKRQTIGTGAADSAYTYDLSDRVTSITYPSGRIVQYAYDTKGRVSSVQTKAPSDPGWTVLSSGYSYEPFGAVKTIAFGNGLTLTNDWGNDGRLASKRLSVTSSGSNLSWLTYNYDANGNLGAVRDSLNDANSIYYGYDANDRLNLASMVMASLPSTEAYTYNSGTNELATLTDSTGTRAVNYDARGNTSGETRPGGASVSTSYDGYARLLSYARTGDPAQANTYNGLDDRVAVTSGSTTHEFVYDPDGRVMGEYGASATDVVAETIWMSPTVQSGPLFGGDDGVGGYAPLAVVAGSGTGANLDWVHGDRMGVPLLFTDATGTSVTAPAYTMVGFPGQTKTLSDLYYNRYRDYDSSLGRYIQADPIGLEGGSNPFVYAEDNPLKEADPSGLEAFALPSWTLPAAEDAGLIARCLINTACRTTAEFAGAYTIGYSVGELCPDSVILWMAQRGGKNKGERGYTGRPDKPDKKMKPVPGRPGWGQEKNPQTGKKGPPKPWPNDPRLK